ncbi:MAG: response regulator [Luteitalea sp.]|nr:response regulator [Luteitalea sp.]
MLPLLRTLIVDDEPLARARLKRLLREERDLEVVGECATAEEAALAASSLHPNIVLLDIQMPGGDGFDLFDYLPPAERPLIIFVTAYPEHAVRAFDAQAIDYLLKPVAAERLHRALIRARRQLLKTRVVQGPAETGTVEAALPASDCLARLAVPVGPRMRLIATEEIDYALARANYVELFTGGRSFFLRETMNRFELRLDPRVFLRVHRSRIVRIDRVEEVEPLTSGQYVIRLKNGVRLTSGRSYRARVRQVFGLG